ncbi:MazG-like pyrophosphatase [Myxococcus phage Mx8]|uniref:p26 n=1 Tax=Myxococcus phage Mx8 TaxID=49964 RepID=Q94MU3_9CAUD|nr:MazG-like pyrophosphatase [Myxococcus phage Mx8]AAK94361.1 p26 [Myxococcus phage Mx8]
MTCNSMTFEQYQQAALRTANIGGPSEPFNHLKLESDCLGLTGEAGEVADHVKKFVGHGHDLDVEKVKKELGDVLWYVAVIAARLDLDLGDVAAANVEKLRKRYPDGFSTEASKARVDVGTGGAP